MGDWWFYGGLALLFAVNLPYLVKTTHRYIIKPSSARWFRLVAVSVVWRSTREEPAA